MASIKGNALAATKQEKQVDKKGGSPLALMISNDAIKKKFEDMLGKKSAGFLSSLMQVANNNKLLCNVDPRTILAAAATAASLDLPINQSLGKAWIVPYKGQGQFQLGYKGLIELAQRSGKMKSIVMVPVYEGEIESWNKFTEEFIPAEKKSDKVVGYYASFELINGFKKATYWTKEQVTVHAKNYSKAYGSSSSPWTTEFDKMACKTVLMSILKTYAPMSIEMQQAMEADGKVLTTNDDGSFEEIEIQDADVVDYETGEVIVDGQASEQQN